MHSIVSKGMAQFDIGGGERDDREEMTCNLAPVDVP
jgi:hypothetical protein